MTDHTLSLCHLQALLMVIIIPVATIIFIILLVFNLYSAAIATFKCSNKFYYDARKVPLYTCTVTCYNKIITQPELAWETMTIPGYTKSWRSELPNGGTSGELSASNKEKWTILRVIPCY